MAQQTRDPADTANAADPDISPARSLHDALVSGDIERARGHVDEGASPSHHEGRGSSLFIALEAMLAYKRLFLMMLAHPDAGEVINGTADSWPPFLLALAMGDADAARAILRHPSFDPTRPIHKLLGCFCLEETEGFWRHPDALPSVDAVEMRQVINEYFQRRLDAGVGPTLDAYIERCNNAKDGPEGAGDQGDGAG